MLLGCIADDFTGASDLAKTLARGGMATMQFAQDAPAPVECEAGVVALKTRSVPQGTFQIPRRVRVTRPSASRPRSRPIASVWRGPPGTRSNPEVARRSTLHSPGGKGRRAESARA